MKRRISDLLDHYSDDTIAMENSASLSSQRIKELTMQKIDKKAKKEDAFSPVSLWQPPLLRP